MPNPRPTADLATHEVTNQPPQLVDYNLFEVDTVLREALLREGVGAAEARVSGFGAALGAAETLFDADTANRMTPELHTHDRYGHRIDEVSFHPAYHNLMKLGIAHRQPSIAWTGEADSGHVTHCALEYLMHQVEAGVCCPMSMTYAGVPALQHASPDIVERWVPKLLSDSYDPSCRPISEKSGATLGMAMTEKQGGSDVRANTTKATPIGQGRDEFTLRGHKWFCSAPMSDGFLTLAYTDQGLTCFLVPRWLEGGDRNRIFIQRLKDKLGNKSNASAEIEYHDAWAQRVGEEGRGVNTIIEMVHHTRLDTTIGAASLMRAGLMQAIHHARHRRVFQKTLIDQPLMRNVLADLSLEVEAATMLGMRIARAFDENDPLARLSVAIGKYWLNKRVANFLYEAMECLGGAGYVEEAPLARLYREAPLNSIWEGSGNVICLDVLRAMSKEPQAVEALMEELGQARGVDKRYDAALNSISAMLKDAEALHLGARRFVEGVGVLLQAGLMLRHAPQASSDAFVASRLEGDWGRAYGTLPTGADHGAIIERAWPAD